MLTNSWYFIISLLSLDTLNNSFKVRLTYQSGVQVLRDRRQSERTKNPLQFTVLRIFIFANETN
ncbi:hypothetical protein HanHA89_Chr15g0599421 [Helianthus annuus]|nr:hypothetical protein HanHA89_Chr15g0599421 [Helianthus annuus]